MSLVAHHKMKLSPLFYGNYRVLKKVGKVAYQWDFPASSKIHYVFNVSYLKKKLGKRIQPLPSLPLVGKEGEIQLESKAIVNRSVKKLANH